MVSCISKLLTDASIKLCTNYACRRSFNIEAAASGSRQITAVKHEIQLNLEIMSPVILQS
jgi:hypothetical protein